MPLSDEKGALFRKSPIGSTFYLSTDYFNPFQEYQNKLNHNAHVLKNKFPSIKLQKIIHLLE